MGVIRSTRFVQATELGRNSKSSFDLARDLQTLPRNTAFQAICDCISGLDHDGNATRFERELLTIELRNQLEEVRSRSDKAIAIFHFQQLLLVLALIAKHSDFEDPDRDLSIEESQILGETCLSVSAFCEEIIQGGDWSANPTGEDLQFITPNILFSLKPSIGFMSIFRSSRILIHGIPFAEKQKGIEPGSIFQSFETYHDLDFEKAWSLLAIICNLRYPTGGGDLAYSSINVSDSTSVLNWSNDEIDRFKSFAVRSLDQISLAFPSAPLTDQRSTFEVFLKFPLIEVRTGMWWAHRPFLSEYMIRGFYGLLRSSMQGSAGKFDEVFGASVENYVRELIELAKAHRLKNDSLEIAEPKKMNQWYDRKPEFEVGHGRVRQLIEVKAIYFDPIDIFDSAGNPLLQRIEQKLLSEKKGIGQLASYAVGRYAGLGGEAVSRLQSILLVLESLPTFIPGVQLAARQTYSNLIDRYSREAESKGHSIPTLGPAHKQLLLLSIADFEYLAGNAANGHDLKDLVDALFNRVSQTLLGAQIVLDEIPDTRYQSYQWLGSTYDELFELIGRSFYKAFENVSIRSTSN